MTRFEQTSAALSWGRTCRTLQNVAHPAFPDELPALVREGAAGPHGVLAAGLRRSYGDSCINGDGQVIAMAGLDRFIAFDPAARTLRADAGVSLAKILELVIPHGLFLPVTPGTRNVTLGGAVANDVHGKNHHGAGTFGRWVRALGLLRSDGTAHVLTPDDPTGLFAATIGGLGLTGLITWVEIGLMPVTSSLVEVQNTPFGNLAEFFALNAEVGESAQYSVAWIDCLASGASLGRGLYSAGCHAKDGPLEVRTPGKALRVPLDFPSIALGKASVTAFNTLYFANGKRKAGSATVPYLPFFYPLDAIADWNRMYGQRGMYQYQSVVPPAVAQDATAEMLRQIAQAGEGSFLVVLKSFGALPSPGMLSFPREGTTLALDFPNRGDTTLRLLARLDAVVREAGGRLYPAKDGRLPADLFRAGYPALDTFRPHVDAGFSSSFWRRINA